MSAEEAYRAAQDEIARERATGGTNLHLDISLFQDLKELPPEIGKLKTLGSLKLNNTQVADLTPVAGLTALTTLHLINTQVADLAPIAGLTALESLFLTNTQVADLSHVAGLTSLTKLYLKNTKVVDLTPIASLTALTGLSLTNTHVADLTPIADLTTLVGESFGDGLYFLDTPATQADPELDRLSRIKDDRDRTEETLAYLRAQRDRAPDPPEDRPTAPAFTLPEGGPITPQTNPLAPDDPTQAALHDETRRKTQRLISTIGDSNQHALLREDVVAYGEVIDPPETQILADLLLSRFNTLRHALEAHQAHAAQDHIDALPEAIARALQDLVETHGLYALGKPGMAEAEARAREILQGPAHAEAIAPIREIAASIGFHRDVATSEATAPLEVDAKTADPSTPSGRMALGRAGDTIFNMLGAVARRVWHVTAATTTFAAASILGPAIPGWLKANQALIEVYFAAYIGTVPA